MRRKAVTTDNTVAPLPMALFHELWQTIQQVVYSSADLGTCGWYTFRADGAVPAGDAVPPLLVALS